MLSYYGRHLLTELGDVFVDIPRTRLTSAARVLERHGPRNSDVDRAILSCYVLACSTRKVPKALAPILDERRSSMAVSRSAETLDDSVASFHKRPFTTNCKALVFDGVVCTRKAGAGAVKRPVLVAFGIRVDGKKKVLDCKSPRLASSRVF